MTLLGVILAGGKSQRFGGAEARPKPLVSMNGQPMILHAAAQLVRGGARRICVLSGANHDVLQGGLGLGGNHGRLIVDGLSTPFELRFSGAETGTGGRLLSLDPSELRGGALISYTDVFTSADLHELCAARIKQGVALAMLTVAPRLPWGRVVVDGNRVTAFDEKPVMQDLRINAGVFAADARILDHIHDLREMFEREPMQRLIRARQVTALGPASDWIAIDSSKDLPDIQTDADRFHIGAQVAIVDPDNS